MNPKRHTLTYSHNLNDKLKIEILKAARENQKVTYKGTLTMISADFSA